MVYGHLMEPKRKLLKVTLVIILLSIFITPSLAATLHLKYWVAAIVSIIAEILIYVGTVKVLEEYKYRYIEELKSKGNLVVDLNDPKSRSDALNTIRHVEHQSKKST
jgi:membrane protein implicated in regulation of membrane protease activity